MAKSCKFATKKLAKSCKNTRKTLAKSCKNTRKTLAKSCKKQAYNNQVNIDKQKPGTDSGFGQLFCKVMRMPC